MGALQRFKAKEVERLLDWYARNQRDFPWRKDPNPYWVWLAEIMSQQTQMATLLPYFYRFIEKFPSVKKLAAAPEDDVLAAWTGLGYYSRARNIHRAAKQIAAAGDFPRTYDGWLDIPGVGPYTAAAVSSQCFEVAEPVWDGNVLRVCSRLAAREDARSPKFQMEMLDELRGVIGAKPSQFNQAMMELGATVCTPKSPACGRCPVQSCCEAYRLKAADQFPPPKVRKETVELKPRVVVRLRSVRGDQQAYVQRRGESDWFPGMWDFPSELGGSGEPIRSWKKNGGEPLGEVRHQITHHKIRLQAFVEWDAKGEDGQWISLEELTAEKTPVPLSTTARKVLKLLLSKTQC